MMPSMWRGLANPGLPVFPMQEQQSCGSLLIPFSLILPLVLSVFGPNLLVDHPDVGQRFMVAFLKGLAKYNEGKTPRNLEIIAQYTQLSTDEIDQACWQMMDPAGDFNVDSIIAFQDWAISKGYMETAVTAEQLFDPSFIEYARELVP